MRSLAHPEQTHANGLVRGVLGHVLIVVIATQGCLFSAPRTPGDGRVTCDGDVPCADGLVCVVDDAQQGRCFAASTPCSSGTAPAHFVDDGTACAADDYFCETT